MWESVETYQTYLGWEPWVVKRNLNRKDFHWEEEMRPKPEVSVNHFIAA